MTFAAESAATIRDRALEIWRDRYLARGEDLDVSEGSDAYNEIDALALEFEGLGLGAQEAARRVLLRYATGQDLDDFAEDDGTARKAASAARRVIRVSGPVSSTTSVGGATMSTAGLLRWAPISPTTGAAVTAITTDGSGNADVTFECATPGVVGNLTTGTVLTWSSAPTGFAATGTVVAGSGARQGEDSEGDLALRNRLLERRRERPASGNRADVREWARAVAGVGDAFVHPCTQPPSPTRTSPVAGKLGCWIVCPVSPPPSAESYVQNADGTLGAGLDPSYTRRPTQALCDDVAGYIDGTLDANGNAVDASAQRQLYPASIDRTNWDVLRAAPAVVDVTVELMTAATSDFAFDGTRTISSVTSSSRMILSSVASLGIGSKLAFNFASTDENGPTTIRGGWALGEVLTVNTGTREITLVSPLPAVPAPGALVRSDPGVWAAVLAAVLAYFDALGVAAPTGLGRSERFPPTSWGAIANVVPSRMLAAALGVSGVTDAGIVAPSATSSPALGYLAMPGVITIQRKSF